MVDIPFDVVTEILSWVPARSLSRFRSVCRSWYALLHEPRFIRSHLLRANQSNPDLSILYNLTDNTNYCVDLATSDEPVKLQDLPFFKFHGSCNGLVCTSRGSSITLWNPTTREYKELPPPLVNSTPLKRYRLLIMGFGWDLMKDDYKVLGLQVKCRRREIYLSSFMVYTLRTNSWRGIRQSTFLLKYSKSYRCEFINGGLHWLVKTDDFYNTIVSFDLGKEVFKEIHLPEYKDEAGKTDYVSVGVLQECLCVSVARNNISQEQMDIWIMRRYGVEDSWSKLVSIERSHITREILEFASITPVGFQKGKLVLAVSSRRGLILYNRGLILYNTETGSVEDVAIYGNWCYLGSHAETLVSLKAY